MGTYHSWPSIHRARRLAESTPRDWICPWCGVAFWARGYGQKEGDHIVPMDRYSEIVVAHRQCHRGRHGIIPDGPQMDRILNSDKVMRSCSKAKFISYLRGYSERVYGSPDFIYIAIANTGRAGLRRWQKEGYTIDSIATRIATMAGMRNNESRN